MRSWNYRNGQRATVKRPGTRAYHADFDNKEKQFFEKKTLPGCLKCGSSSVIAKGGNGRLFVYCADCGKLLKVINTKPSKVGNWSKTKIYRSRAGLCEGCGCGEYTGTMHLDQSHKRYSLELTCDECGAEIRWHNL